MARSRWLVVSMALLLGGMAHAQNRGVTTDPAPVKLDKNKLSYAIGYQIGSQFASGDPDVDIATLQRAMLDAYNKRSPGVPMLEMHRQLQALETQIHDHALSEYKRIAAANARKSAQFLDRNAKQPGVVQLPSGIQYQVLKKGDGTTSPTVSSMVTVNYRGMLIDGTEFDSTWARGNPVSFMVNKVIPGWQDVIPRMHIGDRWKVVIPSRLAYGESGALPRIGPNETLVFEIELIDIKRP